MNGKKEMPGYMTYREAALIYSMLSDNEAAAAIKATTRYFLFGEMPSCELSEMASTVFEIMQGSIDRGRETYQAKIEGGRKGAKSRYEKERTVHESTAYTDNYNKEVEDFLIAKNKF